MDNTTTRNKDQARKIESWILNQIVIHGASNVAKALGMDKSGITRWKESMLPKLSMLLRCWSGASLMTTWRGWQSRLQRFSPIKNARRQPSVMTR